jgi:heme/copper-type cytochrome/quinol oxidase subunit 4
MYYSAIALNLWITQTFMYDESSPGLLSTILQGFLERLTAALTFQLCRHQMLVTLAGVLHFSTASETVWHIFHLLLVSTL